MPVTAKPVYQILATALEARVNCIASNNQEWKVRHEEKIRQIAKDFLPSGAGVDSGCAVVLCDMAWNERIVICFSFNHMNEDGFYMGWTEHTCTVVPSLANGFSLRISGRDRNDVKEYLHDVFYSALTALAEWDEENRRYRAGNDRGLERRMQ